MKVFISYSRHDAEVVQALAEDIKSSGNDVWFDQELTGGQAWWEELLGRIREADAYVFALSNHSLDSHPCNLEYSYASSLGKTILPVRLDQSLSVQVLPPELSQIQWVNYDPESKSAALAVMRALQNMPPTPSLPDPLPEAPGVPISYLTELREKITGETSLSLTEQRTLLFELGDRISSSEDLELVRDLLTRFRNRHDLYERVADEIDEELVKLETAASTSRSGAATPPPTSGPPQRAGVAVATRPAKRAITVALIAVVAVAATVGAVAFLGGGGSGNGSDTTTLSSSQTTARATGGDSTAGEPTPPAESGTATTSSPTTSNQPVALSDFEIVQQILPGSFAVPYPVTTVGKMFNLGGTCNAVMAESFDVPTTESDSVIYQRTDVSWQIVYSVEAYSSVGDASLAMDQGREGLVLCDGATVDLGGGFFNVLTTSVLEQGPLAPEVEDAFGFIRVASGALPLQVYGVAFQFDRLVVQAVVSSADGSSAVEGTLTAVGAPILASAVDVLGLG